MKKQFISSFFFLIIANTALYAQVVFEKRYGTDSKDYERVADAVTTMDGGLLLGGNTESEGLGAFDMFLHKFNPDGSEAWFKTFGSTDLDGLSTLTPATGGGYFFSGYAVNPLDGSFDAWLLKISESGDSLWRQSIESPASDVGLGVCQLTGGNVVLFGFTTTTTHQSALFRALYDSNGNLLNYLTNLTTLDVNSIRARATADGGCIILISEGFFGGNPLLVKYSDQLNEQWSVPVTGLGAQFGETTNDLYDFQASSNGLVFLAQSFTGTFLIRTSLSGIVEWRRKVSDFAFGAGLQVFPGGNIHVGVATPGALVFRTYADTGTPMDSTGTAPTFSPQSDIRFLFPNETQCFYTHNANFFQQNDYFVAFFNLLSAPAISWQQTLGEMGVPDSESGKGIATLPDGGFVLLGTKENESGDNDLWLLKADAQGNMLWEKTIVLVGSSFNDAEPGSVEVDAAGNIIVLGATNNYEGDVHLLKFSTEGNAIFDKTLVVAENYLSQYFRAVPIPGGGFIVCYTRDYDGAAPTPTLFRLDNNGDLMWEENYNGEELLDVTVLHDGDFVAVGQKNNTTWMFRVNGNGQVLWEKTYPSSVFSRLVSVQQAADGNLFAGGISINPAALEAKALILKAEPSGGDALWLKTHSKGPGTYWSATTVLADTDGGCCFVGQFLTPPANLNAISSVFRYRISVDKIDAGGNLTVTQSFGTDGSYPIVGTAAKTPDGNVVFAATINGSDALQDAWVVKTNCSEVMIKTTEANNAAQFDLAPNPASDATLLHLESTYRGILQLRIFDASGREIFSLQSEKTDIDWQHRIPLAGLAPGIYGVNISTGKQSMTQVLSVH